MDDIVAMATGGMGREHNDLLSTCQGVGVRSAAAVWGLCGTSWDLLVKRDKSPRV